ncbi:putative two-component histidine kinase [Vibrio halioticoli NBRC 102217]|uniref:histidine kinase n=1 Tax=Vibrio halioticoli NBRC 102217 TaxID=1219072 RepID=V5EZL8_9VIBR|nr:HAMP domain-containing sensor histidine kinase [Vibrio halioticoli]GAD88269.1 putative two-component histidine kinase [Vibrio halioticoli NBRC 102217]
MKIRASLRLYVAVAMFLSGTLLVAGMSTVAVNYFFYGLDTSLTTFMRSEAFEFDAEDGKPYQVQEMTIATRWQDLPELIQNRFKDVHLENGKLAKKIDGIPILKVPTVRDFLMKLERDGKLRYISISFDDGDVKRSLAEERPKFLYILLFALAAITLFGVILLIMLKQVSEPVRQLRNWAKRLDKKQKNEPTPNFQYSELNVLAEIIESSLNSVQESVTREKEFLGYASHELRTPIAVTRSNAELLQKMIERGINTDKQLQVLDRIRRASFTMTDLTETLLWLNRQEHKQLAEESIVLGDLVFQIQSELRYLLEGKSVNVSISHDSTMLSIPPGLGRIVITNIIRNAFQHTYEGDVVIEQKQQSLLITNHNYSDNDNQHDLGFGLGLQLTDRLIKQYGWYYKNETLSDGRRVEIHFDHQQTT